MVAYAVAVSTGCGPNAPKLGATGTGDVSNALSSRTGPNQAYQDACSDGHQPIMSPRLVRQPYLQAVTAKSARILFWLATAPEAPPRVIVHSADAEGAVSVATPVADASAATPHDVLQLEARFDGLRPDTSYCYVIDGLSDPIGFRTAPDDSSDAATRFVALGDSGTGSFYQRAIAAELETVPYSFLVHLGDLAYESGTRSEIQDDFFGVYAQLARSSAVFPVAGNHDYRTEFAAPLLEAFSLPENAPPDRRERFFSTDWGSVHLVGLDTEAIDSTQLSWLEQDLAGNAGKWLIVFGHRPLYSSGEAGGDPRLRGLLGPIFERHRVHLVLAGHEHDYERTRPIDGVTYLVSGGGGRGTRPVSRSGFTAYSEDVLHFLFIEATAEALVVHAIDGMGREFDGVRLDSR